MKEAIEHVVEKIKSEHHRRKRNRVKIIGKVNYHKNFKSEFLQNERDIIVWLPSSYSNESKKSYPVLYMHDGQNIMNPKTSFAGVDWQVDEATARLIKTHQLNEIIIVGINNTPDRLEEYSDCEKGTNYLRFIVEELMPFVNSNYRTKTEPDNTAIMGSSMGGLISFLAAWKFPNVFGKAGCLSSSFYYDNEKAIELVNNYNGEKKNIKVYIDHGEDGLLRGQKMFCALSAKGFIIGTDVDYFYAVGAQHNEAAWADRLDRPLLFLFGSKTK